jgi:2,6-dihydroxypyridine 3-monooxygenase
MPEIERIAVIGGSHAGLLAAIALQTAGFDVHVFERASEGLRGTGAGIRVQPMLADMLLRHVGIDMAQHATRTRFDRHLAPRRSGPGNRIVFEQAEDGQFASWGTLYRALRDRLGPGRYSAGEACVDALEHGRQVELCFASGRTERADLVVHADGIASAARGRLAPAARMQYTGYVAWRGLVAEAQLSAETRRILQDARVFVIPGLSHVILYPVLAEPGTRDTDARPRLINAIWYHNVAEGPPLTDLMTDREGEHRPTSLRPGMMGQRHVDAFRRDVESELPPAAVEVFALADPFVTPIYEVEPDRMAFGRQVLIGDAAAATRPHVSASTARAMQAAQGLARALHDVRTGAELADALAAWEAEHVAIARHFTERGRMIGRRLQVEGTFVPGDPELTQITMPAGL